MVADIFEDFEPPYKTFLAMSLGVAIGYLKNNKVDVLDTTKKIDKKWTYVNITC